MKRAPLLAPVLVSLVSLVWVGCSQPDSCGRRGAAPKASAPCAAPMPVPSLAAVRPPSAPWNREAYDHIVDNPFVRVGDEPLSTFSIDVDTASYANVRRFLEEGQRPPAGAVRVEEMINYFPYSYPAPLANEPFAVQVDAAGCPWAPEHRLVRIGLHGREIARAERPPMNLVFLVDVSGSMDEPNKLPLVRSSLEMLTQELTSRDRVSIVVYAGAAGLVLPPTSGDEHRTIIRAVRDLTPGGSTNGAEGITLAYSLARKAFVKGGVNRVVLATDGDFNVGITSRDELVTLIEREAKSGIFLTALGYGMENLQDATLEQLADKGNGNYGYIDGLREAHKVLVEQAAGTLVTIAKDVKIQVEWNPAHVAGYRLIGYEDRLLAKEDFNDDRKDAGEIGSGHTVTALYEVVPAGLSVPSGSVDPLKYGKPLARPEPTTSPEWLTVKLRSKAPDGDVSSLVERPFTDDGRAMAQASDDFRFASAVAAFGMLLRDSPWRGTATYDGVARIAKGAVGDDPRGYRREFIDLVAKARRIADPAR